jgi:hypothetical protein
MTANAIATATSISVDTDTGWLSDDEVGIASTTRTPGDTEVKALSSNASSSALPIAALTNAHLGADTYVKAEVILLTRNVKIRSTSNSVFTYVYTDDTALTHIEWCELQYMGSSANNERRGIVMDTTTGSAVFSRCCSRDSNANNWGIQGISASVVFTLADCSVYGGSGVQCGFQFNATALTTAWSITNFKIMAPNSGTGMANLASLTGTLTGLSIAGFSAGMTVSVTAASPTIGTVSDWTIHSSAGLGLSLAVNWINKTFTNLFVYRNGGNGINLQAGSRLFGFLADTWVLFGNTTNNLSCGSTTPITNTTFLNAIIGGDTSFATSQGFVFGANIIVGIKFVGCSIGVASGLRTTHTTADFQFNASSINTTLQILLDNTKLGSGTRLGTFDASTVNLDSFVAEAKKDQVAGAHARTIVGRGILAIETSTVHSGSTAEKLTPNCTGTLKMESGPRRRAVASGSTLTFTAYVRKDGSYVGAQPRLMVRRNQALGITTDTVLATYASGSGSYNVLTGTTAAASDDGVIEAYVDCDGAAGNVFVDDWSVTMP